jgi:hypothetical protein
MCDKELLVGYLYDEVEPSERRAFETHNLSCAECRGELKGLRATKTRLQAWAPPRPELAFQVVRGRPSASPRGWGNLSPAWGLAAAAVLVLSVASAVANVEVRYGSDGLVVRTGWSRPAVATAGAAPATSVTAAAVRQPATEDAAAIRKELQAVSLRVQELESELASRPALAAVHATPQQPASADLMRQVRLLVSESENRQERELALRISQVLRDVEGARRVDLDRMQRGLAEVQGVADTTILRQREMENHFLRVVQQPR